MNKRTRSRNYCFTSYNLKLDFESVFEKNACVRYVCVGLEKCPSTSREHYQGWVQFETQKSLRTAKKIFGDDTIHLEKCFGTEGQNDKYCKKDGNYKQYGKCKVQGQRTDLYTVASELVAGATLTEIAEKYPGKYVQYARGFKDLKERLAKKERSEFRKLEVVWCSGSTGTGKTRYAMEQKPYKIQGSDLKWWDGYEGEDVLLIDEYNNDVGITTLLKLLDGYELRLEVKGGHTYANWTKVLVTTNLHWDEVHPNAKPAHKAALTRRISEFKYF